MTPDASCAEGALDTLFRPRSIAVIGASVREDAIGARVIGNLRRIGYSGHVLPVNPRYREVAGLPCLASVDALPRGVECAFIALPAQQTPDVLDAVGARGIRAAFVNASGFADGGGDGRALQQRLQTVAQTRGIALCGPNNMGLVNVHDRVAAWTQLRMTEVRPGPVAVISQSGSVALVLAQDERALGLAYVVTTGNEAVLSSADYLDYVVHDERVQVVLLFLESIRDPARFAAAAMHARTVGKPIIAIKSGASPRGKHLVAAHTDSLAGDDDVYDAFFRKHGVIRARDLDEMIETTVLLTAHRVPPRRGAFIAMTLSGGEAALIADVSAQIGLPLEPLAPTTIERLQPAFPPFGRPDNPLDAWGLGFNADRFGAMLDALAADPAIASIGIAIDAPAAGGGDTGYALAMADHARRIAERTPIVFFNNACGGGPNVQVREALAPARIPYLSGMRPALSAIAHWRRLGEPVKPARTRRATRPKATTRLDDLDLRRIDAVLREAGVSLVATRVARSSREAIEAAASLGYPVVLKARAAHLPHKTEHGLVHLSLDSTVAVEHAYADLASRMRRLASAGDVGEIVVQPMLQGGVELIAGVRNDPSFGTIVVAGLGGVFVELIASAAVRLAPIDIADARDMLLQSRAERLLAGFRGAAPCDVEAAAAAIVAVSEFGATMADVVESIEINPLVVLERGAFGVDVLVRFADPRRHREHEEAKRDALARPAL